MPATISVSEYVKRCSPEEKDELFNMLVKEIMRSMPREHMIPLSDEKGKEFGYFVSAATAQHLSDKIWKQLPKSATNILGRKVDDLEDAVSTEDLKTEIRQVERKRRRQ
jgi:hypothetical protein